LILPEYLPHAASGTTVYESRAFLPMPWV